MIFTAMSVTVKSYPFPQPTVSCMVIFYLIKNLMGVHAAFY
jgi:hypothetical protein